MAAGAPPADDAADLMVNLSLDSQTKSLETSDLVRKPSVDTVSGQIQTNKSVTPLVSEFMDPALAAYYPNSYPYYYGGYDGITNDWADYSRYLNSDGFDLAHGVYGYGYGYGYAPYGAYSPAGSPDGQAYGAQHYQYPGQYFHPATSKGETTTPTIGDQLSLAVNTAKGIGGDGVGSKGNSGPIPVKPAPYQNSAFNANGLYGVYSSIPWLDGSMYSDPQSRNNSGALRIQNHLKSPNSTSGSAGYMNKMYQNKLYSQYGNTYNSCYYYGTNAYGLQNNGRLLTVDSKYKSRVRGNGFFGCNNDNTDGLNELNRGPRARTTKNQKPLTPISAAVNSQDSIKNNSDEVKDVNVTLDREQYNKSEFPETYADAKFFIIKSYSEDDVHKSIKYNVWASTQNGNKKLDSAYHEAQKKFEKCPVFLFFSVNTSGQFVGVAEMVGPVDFEKSLEYWQQDKWIGCFPVKWHIVKDLPNSLLKHIILENNESKPVTNSRDTQEVKLVQGSQVIKIFKEHSSKQCILDDFDFYEERQKKIQQKKAKQQFQKQAWEGKLVTDEKIKDGIEGLKLDDDGSGLVNEVKLVDNVPGSVAKPADLNVVVSGVANAC